LGPIPNPQSPIPNPQSPFELLNISITKIIIQKLLYYFKKFNFKFRKKN